MSKRTLYLGSALDLNIRLGQLHLVNRETGEHRQTPVEDIGVVLFDHPELIYSHAVVQQLMAVGAAVIYCDEKRLPAALLLPLEGHSVQTERFRDQLAASLPLRKQLWQRTIQAKIRNQARLLEALGRPHEPLLRWATEVLSGDSRNHEAHAARHHWAHLFGPATDCHHPIAPELQFRRERYGQPPNNLLNYGYAILRAAVARALTASGLLPTVGIHHHNRYNAYCLADDIMEPYRPWVDAEVQRIVATTPGGLTALPIDLPRDLKARLLGVLTHDVHWPGEPAATSPLLVALAHTTASLAACFAAAHPAALRYPVLWPTAAPPSPTRPTSA